MLQEFLKVFDLHDAAHTHSLPKVEVATVLRSCGRFMLPKEMDVVLRSLPDPVPRDQFAELVKSLKEGPKEKDLVAALQAFDYKDLNSLTQFEFRNILVSMTEKMSKDDSEQVMATIPWPKDEKNGAPLQAIHAALMTPHTSYRVPNDDVARRIAKRSK